MKPASCADVSTDGVLNDKAQTQTSSGSCRSMFVCRRFLVGGTVTDQPGLFPGCTASTNFKFCQPIDFRATSRAASDSNYQSAAGSTENAALEYVAESSQRESSGTSSTCRWTRFCASVFSKHSRCQPESIFAKYDRRWIRTSTVQSDIQIRISRKPRRNDDLGSRRGRDRRDIEDRRKR